MDEDSVAVRQLSKCASIVIQSVYSGFTTALQLSSRTVEEGQIFEPSTNPRRFVARKMCWN